MAVSVLSIGQCGYDDSRIGALVARELDAVMDSASSTAEARRMIAEKKYDLLLVNRIFDATGESGIALITEAKKKPNSPPMMLVSNYQDAQAQAIAAGATMGFGKSSIDSPEAGETLRAALNTGKSKHDGSP